jgi:hypothetical protein
MTTTTIAAPTADVAALATIFDVIAKTPSFGVETLYARYQELRVGSARHNPDVFFGLSFSTVLDRVLDFRSNPVGTNFNVLVIAAETRS